MLYNLFEDCDNVIIKECEERCYDIRKQRWSARKEKDFEKTNQDVYGNPTLTKKRVIDLTNYDIDINNKEADLKEESCESSFKVNEDYEMEEDEEFAERNFYHTYLFCYCYVYGQLSCRFASFVLRLKKEKKYSLVFLLFLVVVFLK